ncbi:hypothetical protein [Lysinibacillus odysseyi]|uniref:Prophage pi2 protein 40 n=1 Tax=Lysinibacillus odysseyi 34hs-1 = NBRC 100172 TaxID=1220589 RepID=A0A0A3IWG3_9BACI|nr:hypothetical protein [Lysinibacillus odysseyi]KGR89046.1 hypothetical protein CD32_00835 [Lysinibacillus odysseyi 34hs-1 = NBRC 100172]
MEITLTIDGKEIPFKSTGAAVKRYMAQFQRDLLKDIMKMGVANIDFDNMTEEQAIEWMRDHIDFNMFYDVAWVYAKTANPAIPEPFTWLDSFDEFPILDVIEPLQELLIKTIGSKKK